MPEYFCDDPWVTYATRSNGFVRVCCYANQGPGNGILRKDDGSPYTYKDKINKSRNCQLLKEIRLAILNKEWHPECVRCQREYNSGSIRNHIIPERNKRRVISLEEAMDFTNVDGSIDVNRVPIGRYDLRFGTKCNLRCRMCYATDSDSWYQDLFKIYGFTNFTDLDNVVEIKEINGKYIAKGDPYSWFENDIFWENIKEYLHTVEDIYIVGGEPMLIERHFELLQSCIDTNNSHKIQISYNTNATILPEKAMELWKQFKKVHFGASIDGIGELNNYIRYPSRWEVIEKNIKKLFSIKKFSVTFDMTVSVYNILNIVDVIRWGVDNLNLKNVIVNSHPVHGPVHFNIKMFPPESKIIIKNILLKQLQKMKDDGYTKNITDQTERILNYYIKFMNQDDFESFIDYFWEINNKLDIHRKQNIKDVAPELIKLLRR
jgi:sulfatase maturation enzyme AslB (radical SAM superfamily)